MISSPLLINPGVAEDVFLALIIMQSKGYIHRDVSAGNILFHNNRGKLSDLEFSEKYNSEVDLTGARKALMVSLICLIECRVIDSLLGGHCKLHVCRTI
jgi:serine/threonine protein kinase